MDGVHDMGGMQGFGPVKATFGNDNFRDFQDWEKRMWALSQNIPVKGTNIDWFRHVVELMVPKDYMTQPYFNKWCATYMVLLTDNGQATLDDFQLRKGSGGSIVNATPSQEAVDAVIDKNRNGVMTFEVPSDAPAAFEIGQTVRTLRHMPDGHTRLPRYARGVAGEVIALHGCHPLPDKATQGVKHPEHLYTVRFDARTLWGPDANPRDSVTLDLWESYLVSA